MQVGESLVELVKACMWGAGNVVAAARTGENTDSAEVGRRDSHATSQPVVQTRPSNLPTKKSLLCTYPYALPPPSFAVVH